MSRPALEVPLAQGRPGLTPPAACLNLLSCLVERDHHPALREELIDPLFGVEALRGSHHGLSRGLRNLCFHGS
jgi:hypothetical protein